jgi:hypothetical protein
LVCQYVKDAGEGVTVCGTLNLQPGGGIGYWCLEGKGGGVAMCAGQASHQEVQEEKSEW